VKHGFGRVPGFSIVIPTHQRRERLRMVLERLGRQGYPRDRLEIVVVCDGCTDGSAEMARGLHLPFPTTVLEQINQGPAVARNLGLRHARGPLVLFLDDDVMPPPSFVAEHARAHGERKDRVVIGPLLPAACPTRTWIAWEGEKLVEQYGAMQAGWYKPTPYQFYTGNASVPLEPLLRAGGFNAHFLRAEDVELALRLERAGMQFAFAPRAAAIHNADRSYGAWLRAAFQYGRNDVAFANGETTHTFKRLSDNYTHRHPMLRFAVRVGLRYPALRPGIGAVSRVIAGGAPALGLGRIGHWACSLAFNIEYWRGVSDALGNRAAALALIKERTAA
jgi:GT2 family glycosyltransferase